MLSNCNELNANRLFSSQPGNTANDREAETETAAESAAESEVEIAKSASDRGRAADREKGDTRSHREDRKVANAKKESANEDQDRGLDREIDTEEGRPAILIDGFLLHFY